MTEEKIQETLRRNEELTKTAKRNVASFRNAIEKGRITLEEALTAMYNIGATEQAERIGQGKWICVAKEMPLETFYDSDGSMYLDKIPRKRSESPEVLTLYDDGTYVLQASVNGKFREYKDCDNFPHRVMFWKPFERLNYADAVMQKMKCIQE